MEKKISLMTSQSNLGKVITNVENPTRGDELYGNQIINYVSCGVDLRIMLKFVCHTCIDSFGSSTKILFQGLKAFDKSSNNVIPTFTS